MCTTCGCSADAHTTVTDLDERSDGTHAHEHVPTVGHHHHESHSHAADGHVHEHADAEAERTPRTLRLEQEILAKNNRLAERNRGWFEGRNIVALNLMSAPGAGKTTLLEHTLRDLGAELPMSVVEGDQATACDAERIRDAGGRVVQINTGSGCHLDAEMLARSLRQLDPPPRSLLLIENVGNLVCPALFDLGEDAKVVIMSVTEGEDKPLKYPHMFRGSELLILNKIDLLAHLRFDLQRTLDYARRVNPTLRILQLSAQRGDGLDQWYAWLRRRMAQRSGADARHA